METPKRVGMAIFLLVFGVFGAWASLAPLDGAAVAPGTVMVRSYKKTIQHLEGGIVSEIYVQNGDRVRAGQALLDLDNTQSMAQLEIVNAQYAALKSKEARLLAERDGLDAIVFPEDLAAAEFDARSEIDAQTQIFQARKAAREGEIEVLEQRIQQLRSQVTGLTALKASKDELAISYSEELADIQDLLSQGFSDKQRLRGLERNYATLRGESAELVANISSTEVQIGETRLQILQLDREFLNQVVSELGETQTNLKDINERTIALQDVVSRTTVKAPDDGVITGMQVHTIGGVVGAGTPIAEIVPQSDELIIEAKVSLIDIDRVSEGQEATVRFSAFGSSVPTIEGRVISISADSMVDQATLAPYYLARIEVLPEGMADLGDLELLPGMPAEVFIASGSRTLLQYMIKPFSNALARSFTED